MTLTILDGGMGQELLRRSAFPAHPMWSAKVLMDEPEIVQAVHEDFIRAGAQVITLNNYSATPERLAYFDKLDWFEPLQIKAIALAKAARDRTDPLVKIGGCLPPLHASYRPDLSPDFDENLRRYREIVAVQKDHVDLFQCETMGSIAEATAACVASVETGLPVWLGLSVADDASNTLRSGEPLEQVLEAVKDLGAAAILLNCSLPESISAALPVVAQTGLRFGAYANGFTSITALQPGGTVDGLQARTDLGPQEYADFANVWVDQGATIIGGCCEVGPAHIAELSQRFAR